MPKLSKSGTSEPAPRKQLYRVLRYYEKGAPEIVETGLTHKQAKEWIAQHKLLPRHAIKALFYGMEEDNY